MNKVSIFTLLVLFLAIGLLVENQFDIINKVFNQNIKSEKNIIIEKDESPKWDNQFEVVQIKSPIDSLLQPAYFYKTKSKTPKPLIVSLHTWSKDYTQYDSINHFSLKKDYNYIHPNFRGVSNTKDACCSELVISDIDTSIEYAIKNANVDTEKIYVIGFSGGGYATLAMFMKSKHKIKKFSSWCPLVDLVQWYDEAKLIKIKHANEILLCTNSKSGILNEEVAKRKSPINWETPIAKLDYTKLEIHTGLYDGMRANGVIPITHSINFYNKLLKDLNTTDSSKYISNSEKLKLLEFRKPLADYGEISGRKIALIKEVNNIKLTLFEGGHEILKKYAFDKLVE